MNGYPEMAGKPGFDPWGRAYPPRQPDRYAVGSTKIGTKVHAVEVIRGMRTGWLAWSLCKLPVVVLGPREETM